MKTLLLFAIYLFSSFVSYGQTTATEAKAAYLLAEEAYTASDKKGM